VHLVTSVGLFNLLELGLTCRCQQEVVHLLEDFTQGGLVVATLERVQLFQLVYKVLLDVDRDLLASMAVEYSENRHILCDIGGCNVRVLLGLAPTLHAGCAVAEYIVLTDL